MATDMIDIGGIKVGVDDLASQGNAVLGIRDSGKTYTATYLGERLIEAQIPLIACDPIGVWRYLRVPGAGPRGRGYEVVIAGGENGDLPLTPKNAADIVRAAMAENVSLVLDLYSIELSKADWRRIVEECVRALLYHNKRHGLRHVIIEEAAEFCPQRVGPDVGRVYAEIEKLARMGGNALLGYTLVNQRPEEVSKAVLELCDRLFLHRQKGRHSITALSKWMDAADAKNADAVRRSLPQLAQGECWLWDAGSNAPVRIQIPPKRSFHPNRRQTRAELTGVAPTRAGIDVGAFVQRLRAQLDTATPADAPRDQSLPKRPPASAPSVDVAALVHAARAEVSERAQKLMAIFEAEAAHSIATIRQCLEQTDRARQALTSGLRELASRDSQPRVLPTTVASEGPTAAPSSTDALPKTSLRVLNVLAQRHPLAFTAAQWASLARMTAKGGGFQRHSRALRAAGLVAVNETDRFHATPAGLAAVGAPEFRATEIADPKELVVQWKRKLEPGAQRMLDALVSSYPRFMDRANLADLAHMQVTGGGFQRCVSALRRANLLEARGRSFRASPIIAGDISTRTI